MNKEQEIKAEEIIKCLKKHNGKTTFDELNGGELISNTMVDTSTILQYLEDLKLVEDMGNKLFRLTIRGSKFESLKKTYKEEQLKIENLEANLKAAKRSFYLTVFAILVAAASPFITVVLSEHYESKQPLKTEETNSHKKPEKNIPVIRLDSINKISH